MPTAEREFRTPTPHVGAASSLGHIYRGQSILDLWQVLLHYPGYRLLPLPLRVCRPPARCFSILEAMKELKALNISGTGLVTEGEFQRLHNLSVLTRGRIKVRVDALWKTIPKDREGSVERQRCWAAVLADKELASIVGSDQTSERGRRAKGSA